MNAPQPSDENRPLFKMTPPPEIAADSRSKGKKRLLMLLAFIGDLLPFIACVTLLAWYIKTPDVARYPVQYQYYQAEQQRKSQMRQVAVGLIVASVAGCLLSVVSLCGLDMVRRGSNGDVSVSAMAPAVLGIILNIAFIGGAAVMHWLNAARNPFSPA
jgi:hypothetical protein